jgi:hypothetical protein
MKNVLIHFSTVHSFIHLVKFQLHHSLCLPKDVENLGGKIMVAV